MMLKKQISKFLLSFMLLFSFLGLNIQAEEYRGEAVIVITQEFTNYSSNKNINSTFNYELIAAENAPLPDGSNNNVYSFQVTGNNHANIAISYSSPGLYNYSIRQLKDENKKGYKFDDRVYSFQVSVVNTDDGKLSGNVILPRNSEGKKINMIFSNSYGQAVKPNTKPSTNGSSGTNTAAETNRDSWSLVFLLSIVGIALFIILTRKEKQKEVTNHE